MKLYDFTPSTRCRKVRIVLAEKGLEYETVTIDLMKGEHKSPEYAAINPNCKVPTFTDGEFRLWESTIIAEYLEEKYPETPLLPTTPEGKALVRLWMKHADTVFDSAIMVLVIEKMFKPQPDEEACGRALQTIDECLQKLEGQLKGDYILGEYSLADICYYCWVPSFEMFGVKVDSKYQKVNAWIERMAARKAVQAAK